MESTYEAHVPATESDAHLTDDGAVLPHVSVYVSSDPRPHILMGCVGPDGDVPDARMTADEARQLAAALTAAADALSQP